MMQRSWEWGWRGLVVGAGAAAASLGVACGGTSALVDPGAGDAAVAAVSLGAPSGVRLGAPLAADGGTPAAVCQGKTFADGPGTLLKGVSVKDEQDIPAGATQDGASILVQRGACSVDLRLFIADETAPGSGRYHTLEIAPPAGLAVSSEETVYLEPDGLTIIGVATGGQSFLTSARSAPGQVDFGAAESGPFASIVGTGSQALWAPSLSPDELTFFYAVSGDPDANVNGIYHSHRQEKSDPFPPGERMSALIQELGQYVTGVSHDGLSLFVETPDFQTIVLSRKGFRDPWRNPNAPGAPPVTPGFRARPLMGCAAIIGTCDTGCVNENICRWDGVK